MKISQNNANTPFFAILRLKGETNLLKKADIYQCYDQNGLKFSTMYRNAPLTEKKSAVQLKHNKF